MRLGERKLFHIRKSREQKRRFSGFLLVFLFLTLIVYSLVYFMKTIKPIMIVLAETKAQQIAQQAVNDAVIDIFASKGTDISDVLIYEKDDIGSIVAVKSNFDGVNRLKSELALMILDNITEMEKTDIKLPLGMVFGNDMLSTLGPMFTVEFVPYGITAVDFISEFEDAGINQTRLSVELNVKTNVGLLMTGKNETIEVETKVPVIQTVIVGDVPETYTNVERTGDDLEDDVLEMSG